jgi:excinuclease ABC subunit C
MYRLERQRQKSLFKTKKSELRVLNTLKDDLQMHEIPEHVECFDNSNIQGSNPVSACVVFKNGKPSKKDYRHFHIKTVKGPDDFKSMYESVYRRYQRLKNEAENLPQLVVIDGGKGQLSAAVKALSELDLMNEIKIIGIAKKLEEIFQPGDSVPLYIDKNSESLKLIQHLRNEAHRFGIEFHRDMRSKSMTKSVLDEIYGVGPKTKDRLIGAFKTIENIKKAPKQELEEIIGTSKAEIVHRYFQSMGSGKKY